MIFTSTDIVTPDQMKNVRTFAADSKDRLPIPLDRRQVEEFCRRWKIVELAVFGSALRKDFRPDSDVDFLARFAPDAEWSLFDVMRAEEDLEAIVGRPVDLIEREVVEQSDNWIRRKAILDTAEPYYP